MTHKIKFRFYKNTFSFVPAELAVGMIYVIVLCVIAFYMKLCVDLIQGVSKVCKHVLYFSLIKTNTRVSTKSFHKHRFTSIIFILRWVAREEWRSRLIFTLSEGFVENSQIQNDADDLTGYFASLICMDCPQSSEKTSLQKGNCDLITYRDDHGGLLLHGDWRAGTEKTGGINKWSSASTRVETRSNFN